MNYPNFNKAVCINDSGWISDKSILWGLIEWEKDEPGPKEGEIVTVVGQYWSEGKLYFVLKEWSDDEDDGFSAEEFRPIEANFQTVSYEKVMEEESKFVNAN